MTDLEQNENFMKVGKYGVILIGSWIAKGVLRGRYDGKDVIVKRVDLIEDCNRDELKHLRSFRHENIVRYLYNDEDSHYLYIVLEKCDYTLAEFVTDKKHESSLRHLGVLWQIIKGMVYLHEDKDIIHRDLKPHNILMIYQDRRWVVKITDFDISKTLPPDRTRVTQSGVRGTRCYMAPEQYMGHKVGKSIDIFSSGLVFHFVLSEGAHPFGGVIAEVEQKMYAEDATPDLSNIKDEYKYVAKSLILEMISHKQEDRLCIREVQAHHLFWDSKKKLHFYQDVSDYINPPPERFQKMKSVLNDKEIADDWRLKERIQKMKSVLNDKEIADDWRQTIRDASSIVGAVLDNMRNRKQGDEICDLLRNIRNLAHHYNEKGDEFKEEIGSKTDGLCQFFQANFPKLLDHVYESMKRCKAEKTFQHYYTYKEGEHLDQKARSNDAARLRTEKANSSYYVASEQATFEALEPDSPEQDLPERLNETLTLSKKTFSPTEETGPKEVSHISQGPRDEEGAVAGIEEYSTQAIFASGALQTSLGNAPHGYIDYLHSRQSLTGGQSQHQRQPNMGATSAEGLVIHGDRWRPVDIHPITVIANTKNRLSDTTTSSPTVSPAGPQSTMTSPQASMSTPYGPTAPSRVVSVANYYGPGAIIGHLATSSGQVTSTRTEMKEEYNVKSAGE